MTRFSVVTAPFNQLKSTNSETVGGAIRPNNGVIVLLASTQKCLILPTVQKTCDYTFAEKCVCAQVSLVRANKTADSGAPGVKNTLKNLRIDCGSGSVFLMSLSSLIL